MGSYDDSSKSTATALSRALVNYRKAQGLTQAQLAKAVGRTENSLKSYELGQSRPSRELLDALSAMYGVDLKATFPVPGTSAKELAVPANSSGRLRHLIDLSCGGVGRNFAEITGLTKSDVSAALNGRQPLSPAKTELVFRTLPNLNRDWFAQGKGKPFGEQDGKDEAPLILAGRPRKVVSQKRAAPNNRTGPRVQSTMSFAVFDACELTGGFTGGELGRMEPAALGKMAQVLSYYGNQGCGLTPTQVLELANFLREFTQAAGERKTGQ